MTTFPLRSLLRVTLPARGCANEVRDAIGQLSQPLELVAIDASALQFVSPEDICGLRALIDLAATIADCVTVGCPEDDNVHRYLARMNFYADRPPLVRYSRSVPWLRRRDRSRDLVELAMIQTPTDVSQQFERVLNIGAGQFGANSPMTTAFATAVGVAAENSVEHASAPVPAMMAAQRYGPSTLRLAVVDLGLGIPTTLRRNPLHRDLDDAAAIVRSLDDGVSSITELGRGGGLADMIRKISRVGSARLKITSGAAEVQHAQTGPVHRAHSLELAEPARGTWLAMQLDVA